MKRFALAALLLIAAAQAVRSQDDLMTSPGAYNRLGRWSLGVQGGANMWINNFDTREMSGGGDVFLRYALTRKFSLGIMGGYDALQSQNQDNIRPADAAFRNTYIESKGFSGDVMGWYHFTAGQKVTPYVYLGVGGFFYSRKVQGNAPWPSDATNTSIHIPLGVGLEVALTRNVAINGEIGARILNNQTDNLASGSSTILGTDWYPTARVGFTFSFGESDDDDSDGDGLTNGYEKKIGTNPYSADTDRDGLSDGDEVLRYHTDPMKIDTDGDGLSDGDEVNKYHTDPLKVDTDGDGLSDGDEVLKYHTDPLKIDTDGDGLTDGDEVLKYHTDPLKADTDGDGLTDGDEVNKYHTDPLKKDTDGGGVDDGVEVARGTNPLDPADDLPKPKAEKLEVGKAMVLEGIVFQTSKAAIEAQSEATLTQALTTLSENPEVAVEIRGYTDNAGAATANKKLSLRRAEAVRSWLVQKGIDARRITVKGFGPENPIGDNATPEGRAKNRRIEFFRTK